MTTDAGRAALKALGGARASVRGRTARPRIPAAPRASATGLSGLIARGWSVTWWPAYGYRLYKINTDLDTGWCADEKAACDVAKRLEEIGEDTRGRKRKEQRQ